MTPGVMEEKTHMDGKEWSISAISCCQSRCPMLAQNVAVSHLRIRSASPEAGVIRQKRYCISFSVFGKVLKRVCLKNFDHLNHTFIPNQGFHDFFQGFFHVFPFPYRIAPQWTAGRTSKRSGCPDMILCGFP